MMKGLFILLFVGNAVFSFGQSIVKLNKAGMQVEIDPASFKITMVDSAGNAYVAGAGSISAEISGLLSDPTHIHWNQGKNISVSIELKEKYLDVSIRSSDTGTYSWPVTTEKNTNLIIPFYQGKYIPSSDPAWVTYLSGHSPFSGSQDLSMQFFARGLDHTALLYVIKNMYNNELSFSGKAGSMQMSFNHEFPSTVSNKEYGFRIYLTKNNPVAIAGIYKSYVEERGAIVTLEQKEKNNPNIAKLYGAPHIYMWNEEFIVPDNIANWKVFKNDFVRQTAMQGENPSKYLFSLFGKKDAQYGQEFLKEWKEFSKTEWVIKYHKDLLTHAINEALGRKDFYNAAAWKNIDPGEEAKRLLQKKDALEIDQLYRLNELLFYSAFSSMLPPVKDWGGIPLSMLDEMKAAGITQAWLGLSDWVAGERHPEFVAKAVNEGYLIGPYDSYHSMHPPGRVRWPTAGFTDTTLYYRAYVMNKYGRPSSGFLGEGRKLNPTLSMPAVKQRVSEVMQDNGNRFNCWFIDCDATGEILDDYTPGRMTDQAEDIQARLERMKWIRDTYKLVIGSEVGNDFAACVIAYGHGMTTPIIEWSDPDMRKNKNSPYYIGGYFANDGGIPSRYGLQAPLKPQYAYTYFDNRFNIPLYQLVYNNAEITTNHWECNTLKFPDQIKGRELKDILYDVPPLYHLDQQNWNKFKSIIVSHVKAFAAIHKKAVKLQMTAFEWLTADRFVQRTQYGNELEIIANFGQKSFVFNGKQITAQTALIHDLLSGKYEVYTP